MDYALDMPDLTARAERAIKELSGNESLLGMLDTEAASEMLNWGIAATRAMVNRTGEIDDAAADSVIMPRMKLIRQAMRSIGNWAAGAYTDPADRPQLRDRLLENLRIILGEDAPLPSPEEMDRTLNWVDDKSQTPHQLIVKLRELIKEPR
jgi:hypothetical protein